MSVNSPTTAPHSCGQRSHSQIFFTKRLCHSPQHIAPLCIAGRTLVIVLVSSIIPPKSTFCLGVLASLQIIFHHSTSHVRTDPVTPITKPRFLTTPATVNRGTSNKHYLTMPIQSILLFIIRDLQHLQKLSSYPSSKKNWKKIAAVHCFGMSPTPLDKSALIDQCQSNSFPGFSILEHSQNHHLITIVLHLRIHVYI